MNNLPRFSMNAGIMTSLVVMALTIIVLLAMRCFTGEVQTTMTNVVTGIVGGMIGVISSKDRKQEDPGGN